MFLDSDALELIKNSVNVINLSNPLTLTKNITLTVMDCCYFLQFALYLIV